MNSLYLFKYPYMDFLRIRNILMTIFVLWNGSFLEASTLLCSESYLPNRPRTLIEKISRYRQMGDELNFLLIGGSLNSNLEITNYTKDFFIQGIERTNNIVLKMKELLNANQKFYPKKDLEKSILEMEQLKLYFTQRSKEENLSFSSTDVEQIVSWMLLSNFSLSLEEITKQFPVDTLEPISKFTEDVLQQDSNTDSIHSYALKSLESMLQSNALNIEEFNKIEQLLAASASEYDSLSAKYNIRGKLRKIRNYLSNFQKDTNPDLLQDAKSIQKALVAYISSPSNSVKARVIFSWDVPSISEIGYALANGFKIFSIPSGWTKEENQTLLNIYFMDHDLGHLKFDISEIGNLEERKKLLSFVFANLDYSSQDSKIRFHIIGLALHILLHESNKVSPNLKNLYTVLEKLNTEYKKNKFLSFSKTLVESGGKKFLEINSQILTELDMILSTSASSEESS